MFHQRTGSLVTLSNGKRTAQRNHPAQEFNNGVVLSAEPLRENQLFEVKIDRKVNSWSGSIEVGITTSDPTSLNFPTSATGFREGTWVMSGSSILKDGHTVLEEYGQDLDKLHEEDKVGVLVTSNRCLHFYVNGVDQGQAGTDIPNKVYAVVDMYGKCAQVSVVDDSNREMAISNELANEAIAEAGCINLHDRLVFHEKTGTLVQLSNGRKTAERKRPLDEFNNGVVMTSRPLRDDEMFEIRLDHLVDKWSGSIEVGVTTHNPAALDFPATMTNMRSGAVLMSRSGMLSRGNSNSCTVMMSGCGILTNGKGTRREYGEFNLDELEEGDRIGLMRKSNGALHYFINGMDQGVASPRIAPTVWGVVDLYGMAVKVTILDHEYPALQDLNRLEPISLSHRDNINYMNQQVELSDEEGVVEEPGPDHVERLLFHAHCGTHAAVINGGRTAHRPNAVDDFNHAVVLTNRALHSSEIFEVRIDQIVEKWAGSIEIGVTCHSPHDLDFPTTMTNVQSGTWMMTGNGVMHNGTTIVDDYGQNLDRMKLGDRVGVQRKDDGSLHYYVNGVDQGLAASNVPSGVFGVIDLYGQAGQATIIDQADTLTLADLDLSIESSTDELRFHHLHGRNSTILNNGKTAARPNARGEFNDAIVMSNRPLRDNELFEVTIDKMVDRWSGSIEAGVTLILPEDLDFPNTMTDIDYDTWMLSGSAIMQDGSTIRNGYKLDLDMIQVGTRIGMMRTSSGELHYYLDGLDQGVACPDIKPGVYAVIDLYGQCAQVTITGGSGVQPADNHVLDIEPSLSSPLSADLTHRFSQCAGKNISIKNNGCTAVRERNFNNGLIFSAEPLRSDELFEVRIDRLVKLWSGSLQIGMTSMAISDSTPLSILPPTAQEFVNKNTWVVTRSEVKKNGVTMKENYGPSLERLEVNDRVGVMRCSDSTMRVYINGVDCGVAANNIPKNSFAIIDLYGCIQQVTVTSSAFSEFLNCSRPPSIPSSDSESIKDGQDTDPESSHCPLEFGSCHGKYITLSNDGLTATRTQTYNNGVVFSNKPLLRNQMFKVKIEKLNPKWSSSLMIGISGFTPESFKPPQSSLCIKKPSWVISADSVYYCGRKIKENYGPNLDASVEGFTLSVHVDEENSLHLCVNGIDYGVAVRDIPTHVYGFVDLYGQCEQVTLIYDGSLAAANTENREKADMEEVGMKEKQQNNTSKQGDTNKQPAKTCEYSNMCTRFRMTLGLPDEYFSKDGNRCYCEVCHRGRGDEPYLRKGEPPIESPVPLGWCKFSLRLPTKAESLNVLEKWHVAYYGTQAAKLRRILDTRNLLAPGLLQAGEPVRQREKPAEDEDIQQVSVSPSIRYAAHPVFCQRFEYKDPKSKKSQYARVAFQLCIKPGSYKLGPQTVGANDRIDLKISNNEIEWSTKERGATVLCALLVKIE